jgi:hypothetical protein
VSNSNFYSIVAELILWWGYPLHWSLKDHTQLNPGLSSKNHWARGSHRQDLLAWKKKKKNTERVELEVAAHQELEVMNSLEAHWDGSTCSPRPNGRLGHRQNDVHDVLLVFADKWPGTRRVAIRESIPVFWTQRLAITDVAHVALLYPDSRWWRWRTSCTGSPGEFTMSTFHARSGRYSSQTSVILIWNLGDTPVMPGSYSAGILCSEYDCSVVNFSRLHLVLRRTYNCHCFWHP